MLIQSFETESALAREAVAEIVGDLRSALESKPGVTLAVPGGSTARLILPGLAGADLPWQRITITLVDERWVPANHPDSNEALVRKAMVDTVRIVGLFTAYKTPADSIAILDAHVPAADVVLLGMGADGHIASLFPYDPANYASGRFAAVPAADHSRVTMTPKALLASRNIVLVFTGADKRAVFERAQRDGAIDELPVRHVFGGATRVFIGP